ncbi:MAG: hypothetical protein AAFO58_01920 [Pseudomonadota bacterium]
MNQIINMVMRIFMRKVISKGMDKGFEMAAGSRKNKNAHGVSDEDRAEMQRMKNAQKRSKQAMKVGRRIGRM